MAELACAKEKEQLDILNISQKIQGIKMNQENEKYTRESTKNECLYKYIEGTDETVVLACEISSDRVRSLNIKQEGFGLEFSKEGDLNLKTGDRVLELDSFNVFKITRYQWEKFKSQLHYPCKLLSYVLRFMQ